MSSHSMEQVDDMDDSVGKWNPERISQTHLEVNLQVLTSENGNLSALLEQDLLFVWMSRVQGRIHSETREAVVVVTSNEEKSGNKPASVSSWHGKLQGHFETD